MLCQGQILQGLPKNQERRTESTGLANHKITRKMRIAIRCLLSSSSPIKSNSILSNPIHLPTWGEKHPGTAVKRRTDMGKMVRSDLVLPIPRPPRGISCATLGRAAGFHLLVSMYQGLMRLMPKKEKDQPAITCRPQP